MYLYSYKKNIDNLQGEVRKLKNTRDEVQVRVTAAERNVEGIKQNVKDWQMDVEKTITEAEKLIVEEENHPRCFKGLCPNWITRYKHSKKAFKLKQDDISQLLLQEEKFDRVSHPSIPQEIWLRSNEDYLAFESRTYTEKKVWDSLNDENIYMIGVYGMGGLGKTTLVQEVGRKAEKDKLFDDIVFVEVTENPEIKKIQTTIANKLGLKFQNEREGGSEKANKLYSRMEKKNILLIVDNIWKELDLKSVGIPSEANHGRNKILMTTRNVDVLEKMGSTNNFGMGSLNEDEAWGLFKRMAGSVIQTRELNSLPQDVCKECGGLPIVICAIAKALRNKSRPSEWKVALCELRAPSPTKFGALLEKEYQKIALSYNYLRGDELRETFLICSLMKNNTSISDLFKHVVGLDILEGANLSIEEARDRLDKLVRELKDSCLLLESLGSKQFSMHDVIRAVAITIAYTDHHIFTTRNDIEKEWKDKDKLRKCTKICLLGDNVIRQLWHEELDFPNLEFFYMDMKNSFEIHENLFKKMPKLKVLNLFGNRLSSLPLSLGRLINLQTLCLDYSKIEDFDIIGKLKKLKVLSLQRSSIKELTTEICQLTQLRLLDLSNCWSLQVIVPNEMSKLSQLEELYIKGCPIQWKVEVLEELKGLSQLTNLELDIKDNKMLPKGFFSKELRRYKISIGDWRLGYLRINKDESLRVLEFKFNSTVSLEEFQGIKNVEILAVDVENSIDDFNIMPLFNEKINSDLEKMELVDGNRRIRWHSHSKVLEIKYDVSANIPFELLQRFENLKELQLFRCDQYKELFLPNLPNLEVLNVGYCDRLMSLVSFSASFHNLKKLRVFNCKGLMKLITPSTTRSLMQLREIDITDCMVLEEIVMKEEGIEAAIKFVFPQVTLLKLQSLPKLTAFYLETHTSEWPKLKELVVRNCDKFTSKLMSVQENSKEGELNISNPKSIFLDDKMISDLEKMELKNENREIEWKSKSKSLNISGDKSANIPLGLLQRFENLKELKLRACHQYKELKCLLDLPNLEVLNVSYCDRLMSLVPSSASFQNLKVMTVNYCNGLIKLITLSTARSLVQLREMRIYDCKLLEEVVAKEEGANEVVNFIFPNVTLLELRDLPELTAFYPERHTSEWPKLNKLVVIRCYKFTSKHMSFQENSEEGDLNISDPKSSFLDDKVQISYFIVY
ncbi:probable disease resistance protein At4g27220 [Pistacia vera]|uniref:probable disease resistance protein At4g27220 n=1 Tax=Pistacia vera TaxID=55513 RepID=UPI001263C637|nr:probable disease resistance protein At4g27220 [Pistacia vera]